MICVRDKRFGSTVGDGLSGLEAIVPCAVDLSVLMSPFPF